MVTIRHVSRRKREEEKEKETKKGVGNEGRKKEEKNFIFPSKSLVFESIQILSFQIVSLRIPCHEAESEMIINLRPKVEYSSKFMLKGDDEKRCSICLDDYEDGEMVEFLDCFHLFHGDCIDKWLPLSQTCPVCRHQC
ncbi:RING-H2 finger protein ATL39-like [Amaranthus tricolor]|uniref:RING-H2 finger protein ATL39-like n=1 Tax=Amaranthus tricolor TaxID=29722 RepID=UPI00258BA7E9|nr:RING-H2 finger protein ATL39-like [Amaranthus tricolor]